MGNALAMIGIFGLMTYSIRQRRREIGVRMALAATPGTVMRMLIAPGMRYALPGTLIGAAVALWLAHWLKSFLFGVGAMGLRTRFCCFVNDRSCGCYLRGRRRTRRADSPG